MASKRTLTTPKIIKKILISAKKNKFGNQTKKIVRLAMEYVNVVPDFKIVNFTDMQESEKDTSYFIEGEGKYTSTQNSQVQEDVKTARDFTNFLNKQYGCFTTMNFSTENNILKMQIKVLQLPKEEDAHYNLRNHLEGLVLQ